MAPMRAPAAAAWASWACSTSAKAVVCLAATRWPGQRFSKVPNRAVGWPQLAARCSIRWVVVVLPLVPVTPIRANFELGWFQKLAASSPAQYATGSETTTTGSSAAGGSAAAAAGPITAAAPAANTWRQKQPPSTWLPGRPTKRVPAPAWRESLQRLTIDGLPRLGGRGKPT